MANDWKDIALTHLDLEIEDDAEFFRLLGETDVNKLRELLLKNLEIVRSTKFNASGLAKFEHEISRAQENWSVEMLTWEPDDEDYISISDLILREDQLTNDPYQYYVIHNAIENIWGLYSIDEPKLLAIQDMVC